ncbi:MAG: hypothetical protein GY938_06460 [Ketobacter sp.]|nr:hypothetical protein [Ketobacter sp.]
MNRTDFEIYGDVECDCFTIDEYKELNSYYSSTAQAFIDEYDLDSEKLKNQKLTSETIDARIAADSFDKATTIQKARLNACSAKGAAAWIASIPTYSNKIPALEFLTIVRMWIGVKLYNPDLENTQHSNGLTKCKACQKMVADPYGIHWIMCQVTRGGLFYGMTKKHNVIRNIIFDYCKAVHLEPEKEKHGLCINVGKDCPADIYLPVFSGTMPVAIDIGLTNPLQSKYLTEAAVEPMCVGDHYADAKWKKYLPKIDRNELVYMPFVMETFGGMTHGAQKILKKICYDMRSKYKMDFSHIYNLKRRELVIKLWRGNAKMALDRLPSQ